MDFDMAELVQPRVMVNALHIFRQRFETVNVPCVTHQSCRKDRKKTYIGADVVERHARAQRLQQNFLHGGLKCPEQESRIGLSYIKAQTPCGSRRHNAVAILERGRNTRSQSLEERRTPEELCESFRQRTRQAADQAMGK